MDSGQRWFFYAMGGGFGHLCRTVSLMRAVRQLATQRRTPIAMGLVTNSPYADPDALYGELGADAEIHVIEGGLPKRAICDRVCAALRAYRPDVLVVDTFPRGLGGELVGFLEQLGAFNVLTHRDLDPRYVAQMELASWVRELYGLVLAPGELGPLADGGPLADRELEVVATTPWLIRDARELASFAAARKRLEADVERPLIAVLRSGKSAEQELFDSVAWEIQDAFPATQVRLLRPTASPPSSFPRELAIWPFFPWIRGASVIVGAGGYNTVHEARAAGAPLLALPQSRLYDRQRVRLHADERIETREQLRTALSAQLSDARLSSPSTPPKFVNGAATAAAAIWERANREAKTSEYSFRRPAQYPRVDSAKVSKEPCR